MHPNVPFCSCLQDCPSLVEQKNKEVTRNRSRYDWVANRCYCILSRFPFFKLHFEVIYALLGNCTLVLVSLRQIICSTRKIATNSSRSWSYWRSTTEIRKGRTWIVRNTWGSCGVKSSTNSVAGILCENYSNWRTLPYFQTSRRTSSHRVRLPCKLDLMALCLTVMLAWWRRQTVGRMGISLPV